MTFYFYIQAYEYYIDAIQRDGVPYELITKVIKGLSENPENNSKIDHEVRNEVVNLCSSFPIYKNLNK